MGALNDFHRSNIERQHEAFAPAHSLTALVVCVQEEVGELAGAVLGVTGEKARKKHKTKEDVLDAVADAMTYLSLVAGSVGCEDLEKLLGDTFNMVSRRAGSKVFTTLGQESAPPVSEAPAPAEVGIASRYRCGDCAPEWGCFDGRERCHKSALAAEAPRMTCFEGKHNWSAWSGPNASQRYCKSCGHRESD